MADIYDFIVRMYLPRLIDAMRFTEDEAQFKIYQREGFPFTGVNNGKH
ncbi:TPA: hypothetical protein ACHDW3_002040 [Morganella morganii]